MNTQLFQFLQTYKTFYWSHEKGYCWNTSDWVSENKPKLILGGAAICEEKKALVENGHFFVQQKKNSGEVIVRWEWLLKIVLKRSSCIALDSKNNKLNWNDHVVVALFLLF